MKHLFAFFLGLGLLSPPVLQAQSAGAVDSAPAPVDPGVFTLAIPAMKQYEADTEAVKAMEGQYPGIGQPAYAGDAAARARYKEVADRRRVILTKLPEIVKSSVTKGLARKNFAEAADELDRFVKLWVNTAIPEESRRTGGNQAEVAKNMDLGFIVEMEKDFMRKYIAAGLGQASVPEEYRVPKDMVFIPGGYFLMGREDAKYGEADFPLRLVYVEPFLLDRYEVKNKDYNDFVKHVRTSGDYSFEHPSAPPMRDHTAQGSKDPALAGENQPVIGVGWLDAYAYAKWKGKRLATEAEWEKAARGMRMRKYPWGADDPAKTVVNSPGGRDFLAAEMDRQNPPPPPEKSLFEKMGIKDAPRPRKTTLPQATWPVTELLPVQALAAQKEEKFKWDRASVSPYNLFHMGGNAAEWVNDWFDPGYYTNSPMMNPKGPENGAVHILRGGSFLSPDPELRATWRGAFSHEKIGTGCSDKGEPIAGFRCAKSIELKGKP